MQLGTEMIPGLIVGALTGFVAVWALCTFGAASLEEPYRD